MEGNGREDDCPSKDEQDNENLSREDDYVLDGKENSSNDLEDSDNDESNDTNSETQVHFFIGGTAEGEGGSDEQKHISSKGSTGVRVTETTDTNGISGVHNGRSNPEEEGSGHGENNWESKEITEPVGSGDEEQKGNSVTRGISTSSGNSPEADSSDLLREKNWRVSAWKASKKEKERTIIFFYTENKPFFLQNILVGRDLTKQGRRRTRQRIVAAIPMKLLGETMLFLNIFKISAQIGKIAVSKSATQSGI